MINEREAATNPDVNREVPDPLVGNPTRLFVYGSLRRGEYNHARVNTWVAGEKLTHIANGWIQGAALYNLGAYPAIKAASGSSRVIGEVYDVPRRLFSHINSMEVGAGYESRPVQVVGHNNIADMGETPIEALAYFYTGQVNPKTRIHSGDWSLRFRD